MPLKYTAADLSKPPAIRAIARVGGLEIDGDWIYRFAKPLSTAKTVEVLRRWRRFERNVDKLAA